MATVLRTPISQILLTIQAVVIANTGLSTSTVHIVAKKEPRAQADREVFIMPGTPVRSSTEADGSGRYGMVIRRPIIIVCASRCALDTYNDGTVALTDSTQGIGLFTLEEQVLQMTDTVLGDGNGNSLLWEDIRFIGGGDPPHQDETDEASIGMNYSVLTFEVCYMAALGNLNQ